MLLLLLLLSCCGSTSLIDFAGDLKIRLLIEEKIKECETLLCEQPFFFAGFEQQRTKAQKDRVSGEGEEGEKSTRWMRASFASDSNLRGCFKQLTFGTDQKDK